MTKQEKLRSRFLSTPPPKDFTWKELETVMASYGYELKEGKGSHHVFYNGNLDDYIRGIPRPHPGNEVLACYLKLIRRALESAGLI